MVIGNHLSCASGYEIMGQEELKLGGNTFAFFTRNPRGGAVREHDPEDAARLCKFMQAHNFGKLVAHAPYTLNVCSDKEKVRNFSREAMAGPDALVQIASLCIKSGNCAILKGGSETKHTNKILFSLIAQAARECGLPENCLFQAEQRDEISELLSCQESVDLLIPRGSNAFVQYIMDNTKIPVMGHADGICHIYVDKEFDIDKAIPIIIDAKMQYAAACNAVETLLIHKDAVDCLMPELNKAFQKHHIELRATTDIAKQYNSKEATDEDFETEYLDLVLSAKTVKNIDEAIVHINKYGSHHTDCIITENQETAEYFMRMVDSAGVYQNCSTRFADGFRYGFGAEVGISTGKIHARGPVGIEGLLTYKYKLYGNGQIVEDYASGKKEFHFKDYTKKE